MAITIVLDSDTISSLIWPRGAGAEIASWYEAHLLAGSDFAIPSIVDYEVRRGLLWKSYRKQLLRLDALISHHKFIEPSTAQLRRAAEIWAHARGQGRPMDDPKRLGADAIIIAQAKGLGLDELIVATNNVGHFELFVDARPWRAIVA